MAFVNTATIVGAWNAASGVLTLTGADTLANYRIALRAVTYRNTSATPTALVRTMVFQVSDGALASQVVARRAAPTLVTPVAPVLSALETTALNVSETAPATPCTATLIVADADSPQLASATVRISANYQAGSELLSCPGTASISRTWDAVSGTLTLSGLDTPANYQAALRTVTFQNLSRAPVIVARTLTVQVNDGLAASNALARTLNVTAVNDAPTVGAMETIAAVALEDSVAMPVTATAVVADSDSAALTSATVQITTNYRSAEDLLAFVNTATLTGLWNGSTGLLTITGTDTPTNYQAALRTVTYRNSSNNPTALTRTVTCKVKDAALWSLPAVRQIAIAAANDPPLLSAIEATARTVNEQAAPASLTSSLVVTDPDNVTLAQATVAISANYQNGEDVLAFINTASITGTWDAATGRLSLVGVDTVANYQAALRAVTYQATSDQPSALVRTVTFTVGDGTAVAVPLTRTLTVTPVNDAPLLANLEASEALYTEDRSGAGITGHIDVSDADSLTLAWATVRISAYYRTGEDSLSGPTANGITSTWNASTATVTLSGAASPATYQAALRAVSFRSTSQNPDPALIRTLTVQVNDGALSSLTISRPLRLVPVNDRPIISGVETTPLAGREKALPLAVSASLRVADVDSLQLAGATVQIISNYQNSQDVLAFANTATITGTWTAASGTLALSGLDTLANYQAALRAVTYQNTSLNPKTVTRVLQFQVNDGSAKASPVTRSLTVTPVDDAPVLSALEPTPLAFTEGGAAPALSTAVLVTDVDHVYLASATVTISANLASAEDLLSFVNTATITGTWSAASGRLTLTGFDSLARYQAALRSVTYRSTSQNPSPLTRTLSVQVNDGTLTSNILTRTVTVAPVNDAPVLYGIEPATLAYAENSGAKPISPALAALDVDSANLASATVRISTNYRTDQDLLAFAATATITSAWDAVTGTLTLTGADTVANYRTALHLVTYQNTSIAPDTAVRTIAFQVSDGLAASNLITRTITLSSTNRPPTVATVATVVLDAAGKTATLAVLGADDEGEANLIYTWSTTGASPTGVTFSQNRSNAAKNTVVTFTKLGTYSFLCTIQDKPSLTVTSAVSKTVTQVFTTMVISPANLVVAITNYYSPRQYSQTMKDQFGGVLTNPPAVTWSINDTTAATITSAGLLTPTGKFGGPYTITASAGAVSAQTTISMKGVLITQATSNPALDGNAEDIQCVAECSGAASDIIYTWSVVRGDAAAVSFSQNGTNDARNMRAVFSKGGMYTFRCTATYLAYTTRFDVWVSPHVVELQSPYAQMWYNDIWDLSAYVAMARTRLDDPKITCTWTTVSGPPLVSFNPLETVSDRFRRRNVIFWEAGSYVVRCTTIHADYPDFPESQDVNVEVVSSPSSQIVFLQPATCDPGVLLGRSATISARAATSLDDDSQIIYTWSQSSGPIANGAVFSANSTNAAQNAQVTFSTEGNYNLACTASCLGISTVSFVSVQVSRIRFVTYPTVSPDPVSGATANLHAVVETLTGPESGVTYLWSMEYGPATVTFGANNGTNAGKSTSVTFTQAGYYGFTCTASYQGSRITSTVWVQNTALAFSQAPSVNPNPVTGPTATLTALVANGFGPESGVTYTWSMYSGPAAVTFGATNGTNSGKSTAATFKQIGRYQLQCTAAYQGFQLSGVVSVENTGFAFTQAPSVTPNPVTGATATLTALVANGFGPESGVAYTWSMISGPAVVTFGASNGTNAGKSTEARFTQIGYYQFKCTASYQGLQVTDHVTIQNSALAFSEAPSVNPNPVTGLTATLTALAANGLGPESGVTYTWSMYSGPAAVTFGASNGTNAGKSTEARFTQIGYYQFKCTASYQGLQVTDHVTIQNSALAFSEAPSVNPNPVTGLTATLTALAANGLGPESGVTYTWSMSSGPAAVAFGASNGTNAGKSTVATFTQVGSYYLRCIASYQGSRIASYVAVENTALAFSTPPTAVSNPVLGDRVGVSALAATSQGPESGITYEWSAGYGPGPVSFTVNGTNTAKLTEARFTMPGSYGLTCTARVGGLSVSRSIWLNVQGLRIVSGKKIEVGPSGSSQLELFAEAVMGNVAASDIAYAWYARRDPASPERLLGIGQALRAQLEDFGSFQVVCRANYGNWNDERVFNHVVVPIYFSKSPWADPAVVVPGQPTGLAAEAVAPGLDAQAIVYTWRQVSGPAQATFGVNASPAAKTSTASFPMVGDYALEGKASLGGREAIFPLTVAVREMGFIKAPTVGTWAPSGDRVNLQALASAAGIPSQEIVYTWTMHTGPAPVIFSVNETNAAAMTQVTFTQNGHYDLECTASAGGRSVTAEVGVWVTPLLFTQAPRVFPTAEGGRLEALAQFAGASTGDITYTWTSEGPGVVAFGAENATAGGTVVRASVPTSGAYRFRCVARRGTFSTAKEVYVQIDVSASRDDGGGVLVRRRFAPGTAASLPLLRLQSTAVLLGKGPHVLVLNGPPGATVVAEALESVQILDTQVTCSPSGRAEMRVEVLGDRARVLCWSPQARGAITLTSVVE